MAEMIPVRKPNLLLNGKSIELDKIEYLTLKRVTKIGNGAKVDCEKKYIDKYAYVFIFKSDYEFSAEYKKYSLSLNSPPVFLAAKVKVRKFGTGARINCLKRYIGFNALVIITD